MTRHQIETICWKEFVWRRSFKLEQVHEMLAHLATVSSREQSLGNSCKRDGLLGIFWSGLGKYPQITEAPRLMEILNSTQ